MTVVIGAGMAGLLAASMLRKECDGVVERQPNLPNNHSAVLRFRNTSVGDVLNIPFRAVEVMKAVHPWRNPIADALAYSRKTNGSMALRSIVSANGSISTRYIAPPDFIDRMKGCLQCDIVFGKTINREALSAYGGPVISTMPMPNMMEILGWKPVEEFRSSPGTNIIMEIEGLDAYCSLYVPMPDFPGSRISITGSEVVVECRGAFAEQAKDIALGAAFLLGIPDSLIKSIDAREQRYAKILPYNEKDRKNFIVWASETHNVYSLGRFATWRPGLLMDDVVEDVRVIHRLISGGSSYSYKKG